MIFSRNSSVRTVWLVTLLALSLALVGCGDKASNSTQAKAPSHEDEGHDHSSGPHGGQVVIVGDHVAHIEILHEHGAGEAIVHVLDADMKVLEIADAPVLNLLTESGSVRVVSEPGEDGAGPARAWHFRHEALAAGAHEGRLNLKIGGKTYTPDFEHAHGDHGHAETPHHGVLAAFEGLDGLATGFLELKLHDDKGDLELWLTEDEGGAKPFDLPLDTKIEVAFPEIGRAVTLRVRNREQNEDEDGSPNVRGIGTNYFIFPGDTGADASWLQGTEFSAAVMVRFSHAGAKYTSPSFELLPHTHGAGGHAHEQEGHEDCDHAGGHSDDEHEGHDDDS